jgi:dipeptidyl aminopeptidase/acylaminoacyl peptidase
LTPQFFRRGVHVRGHPISVRILPLSPARLPEAGMPPHQFPVRSLILLALLGYVASCERHDAPLAPPRPDVVATSSQRRIAFVSSRDGNAEIYVMNADGTGLTRLTNDPAADFDPAWSSDGSRLAFAARATATTTSM